MPKPVLPKRLVLEETIQEIAGMRSFSVVHGREDVGKVCVEPFGYAVVIVK